MDDAEPNALLLQQETALIHCARAALAWSARGQRRGGNADELLRELMRATSLLGRVYIELGRKPLALADVVASFSQPVQEWLQAGPEESLLEGGGPSPLCLDLSDEGGANPGAELQQRVMKRVKADLAGQPDGPVKYVGFRRALIENPLADERAARTIALEVGVPFAELYERPTERFLWRESADKKLVPCPRCRWPMAVSASQIECLSDVCRREGARFLLRDGEVVPLGKFEVPEAVPAEGRVQLRFGLWRYTTLPGLEELRLDSALRAMPGTEVMLWPNLDEYDLDVRRAGMRWRIDVKDHASAIRLGERLRARAPSEATWIVVPDTRRDQIPLLERLCAHLPMYRFRSVSTFIQLIEAAGVQNG